MKRLALGLVLAFSSASLAAEPLKLEASLEKEGATLRVRIEGGALPDRAIGEVTVTREIGTLGRKEPWKLRSLLVPFGTDGRAEARIDVGEALSVPGRYRIEAVLGKTVPRRSGEATLDVGLDTKAYLAAVLEAEAFFSASIESVGGFLERMNALEIEVSRDREAGLEAWRAWRGKAVHELLDLIAEARRIQGRFYPRTFLLFVEQYVRSGVIQVESRKFQAAESGGTYVGTGIFRDETTVERKILEPARHLLRRETVHYRLVAADALYGRIAAELEAQARRPDSASWDRKRAVWDGILVLEEGGEGMKELVSAFRAWLDRPEDATRQALKDRFAEAQALLK